MRLRRTAGVFVLAGLGAACMPLPGTVAPVGNAPATGPKPAAVPASGATDPGLIPAPQVFAAAARATWDGALTLQGVWIAHPQAREARRVRITRADTGAAVDGALFRRDDRLTGPAVLISSDLALALGMAPKVDTELTIVAVVPAAPGVAQVDTDGLTSTPLPPPTAAPADAQPPAPEPTAAPETATESAADAGAEPDVSATAPAQAPTPARATPAVTPTPKPVAEPVADPVTEPDATATARDAAASPGPGAAPIPEESAPRAPDPAPDPAPDAPAAQPAASVPEPVASAPTAPEPAAAPPPAAAAPEEAPTGGEVATPADGRAFIQAGSFGVAANAANLAKRLSDAGLPAQTRGPGPGGTLTRVIVGPFATRAERDAALARIRALGLPDATAVRG